MPPESQIAHRVIGNTAIPYRSYTDITSNEPNFVAGQNILTSSKQIAERRPGFADNVETGGLTAFSALASEFRWSKWNGTFFSMVCDVSGGVAKVYKYQERSDANYSLLFTSTSSTPFTFVVSNNTLYYGNGTDMRAWTGTGADRRWGIVKPSAAASIATSGTGISSYAGGWYYRVTYYNSANGHESSSSALSTCTGNVSNKQIDITLTASSDSQVTHIRVYRTTDGGSTDPSVMQEISNSPFANSSTTVHDTTSDSALLPRSCTSTTLNDPPTPSTNLVWSVGRIWGSSNATVYFSGAEELGNGVPEECWPSGLGGNYYPFNSLATSLRPMTDGVCVWTRGVIWKIEGTRRDNFIRYRLMDKRGAISHNATASLGNSFAWLDSASQVWLSDSGEVGYDIRTDLAGIDHTQAYMAIHVSNRFHWLMLLDGGNATLHVYDLDTSQWLVPWKIQGATSCSSLSSGEKASGNIVLSLAYNKQSMLALNASSYNDKGNTYSCYGTLNLLQVHPNSSSELKGVVDYVAVETDSHTNSDVQVLTDDDPSTGSYTSLIGSHFPGNPVDPSRTNGTNLVKKLYKCSPEIPGCERASFSFLWAAAESNFLLYTIDIGYHTEGV